MVTTCEHRDGGSKKTLKPARRILQRGIAGETSAPTKFWVATLITGATRVLRPSALQSTVWLLWDVAFGTSFRYEYPRIASSPIATTE
jgi:hypothetical protein